APLPVTWLAVPHWHGAPFDAAFEAALDARRAAGDELALHGCTHRDDGVPRGAVDRWRRRVYTAGEGEFAALGADAARAKLQVGLDWFAERGWPVRGFVAPAWLASVGTWDALTDTPQLRWTCTLSRLVALPSRRALRSQSIVYSTRAPWRRLASRAWNRGVARLERRRPLLRFELHPGDAEHTAVRGSWMRLLERALGEREPLTLSQAAARWLGS
ncbi:MAG TPA: DUF2334 domain-containing protein, partial [Ideonella sp.]|nr:DUF2334 domain-containing protein [Ideonella sp.]